MLSRHPLLGVLVRELQLRRKSIVPFHVRPVEHMQTITAFGTVVHDKEALDRSDSSQHILRPSSTRLCLLLQQEGAQVRVQQMRHLTSAHS